MVRSLFPTPTVTSVASPHVNWTRWIVFTPLLNSASYRLCPGPGQGKIEKNEAIWFFIFNICPGNEPIYRTHFWNAALQPRQRCLEISGDPWLGGKPSSCQTQHGRGATHGNENGWAAAAVRQLGTRPSKPSNFQRSVSHCRRHLTMRTAGFRYCTSNSIFEAKNAGSVHESTSSYPGRIKDLAQGQIKTRKTLELGSLTAA